MHQLFGLPKSDGVQIGVLILCTIIFAASAYSGMKNGIQRLSHTNLVLALMMLAFVVIVGPTVFMAETSLASIAVLAENFFTMAT